MDTQEPTSTRDCSGQAVSSDTENQLSVGRHQKPTTEQPPEADCVNGTVRTFTIDSRSGEKCLHCILVCGAVTEFLSAVSIWPTHSCILKCAKPGGFGCYVSFLNLCTHILMHARTYTNGVCGGGWECSDRSTTLTFLWESPWACSGVERPHQWQKYMYTHKTREGPEFRAAFERGSGTSGSGSYEQSLKTDRWLLLVTLTTMQMNPSLFYDGATDCTGGGWGIICSYVMFLPRYFVLKWKHSTARKKLKNGTNMEQRPACYPARPVNKENWIHHRNVL